MWVKYATANRRYGLREDDVKAIARKRLFVSGLLAVGLTISTAPTAGGAGRYTAVEHLDWPGRIARPDR